MKFLNSDLRIYLPQSDSVARFVYRKSHQEQGLPRLDPNWVTGQEILEAQAQAQGMTRAELEQLHLNKDLMPVAGDYYCPPNTGRDFENFKDVPEGWVEFNGNLVLETDPNYQNYLGGLRQQEAERRRQAEEERRRQALEMAERERQAEAERQRQETARLREAEALRLRQEAEQIAAQRRAAEAAKATDAAKRTADSTERAQLIEDAKRAAEAARDRADSVPIRLEGAPLDMPKFDPTAGVRLEGGRDKEAAHISAGVDALGAPETVDARTEGGRYETPSGIGASVGPLSAPKTVGVRVEEGSGYHRSDIPAYAADRPSHRTVDRRLETETPRVISKDLAAAADAFKGASITGSRFEDAAARTAAKALEAAADKFKKISTVGVRLDEATERAAYDSLSAASEAVNKATTIGVRIEGEAARGTSKSLRATANTIENADISKIRFEGAEFFDTSKALRATADSLDRAAVAEIRLKKDDKSGPLAFPAGPASDATGTLARARIEGAGGTAGSDLTAGLASDATGTLAGVRIEGSGGTAGSELTAGLASDATGTLAGVRIEGSGGASHSKITASGTGILESVLSLADGPTTTRPMSTPERRFYEFESTDAAASTGVSIPAAAADGDSFVGTRFLPGGMSLSDYRALPMTPIPVSNNPNGRNLLAVTKEVTGRRNEQALSNLAVPQQITSHSQVVKHLESQNNLILRGLNKEEIAEVRRKVQTMFTDPKGFEDFMLNSGNELLVAAFQDYIEAQQDQAELEMFTLWLRAKGFDDESLEFHLPNLIQIMALQSETLGRRATLAESVGMIGITDKNLKNTQDQIGTYFPSFESKFKRITTLPAGNKLPAFEDARYEQMAQMAAELRAFANAQDSVLHLFGKNQRVEDLRATSTRLFESYIARELLGEKIEETEKNKHGRRTEANKKYREAAVEIEKIEKETEFNNTISKDESRRALQSMGIDNPTEIQVNEAHEHSINILKDKAKIEVLIRKGILKASDHPRVEEYMDMTGIDPDDRWFWEYDYADGTQNVIIRQAIINGALIAATGGGAAVGMFAGRVAFGATARATYLGRGVQAVGKFGTTAMGLHTGKSLGFSGIAEGDFWDNLGGELSSKQNIMTSVLETASLGMIGKANSWSRIAGLSAKKKAAAISGVVLTGSTLETVAMTGSINPADPEFLQQLAMNVALNTALLGVTKGVSKIPDPVMPKFGGKGKPKPKAKPKAHPNIVTSPKTAPASIHDWSPGKGRIHNQIGTNNKQQLKKGEAATLPSKKLTGPGPYKFGKNEITYKPSKTASGKTEVTVKFPDGSTATIKAGDGQAVKVTRSVITPPAKKAANVNYQMQLNSAGDMVFLRI